MTINLGDSNLLTQLCLSKQRGIAMLIEKCKRDSIEAKDLKLDELLLEVLASQSAILIALASIHAQQAAIERREQRIARPSIVFPGRG